MRLSLFKRLNGHKKNELSIILCIWRFKRTGQKL